MQISSRFPVALHLLACVDRFAEEYKVTSDFLAGSINTNPVVVRRLLTQLKAAGLVRVARGTGGVTLARAPEDITFLDVFRAVDAVDAEGLFHLHENPNPACPVGRNIHALLNEHFAAVERAMADELQRSTLAHLTDGVRRAEGEG